jgi:hypothetical protein
MGYNSWTAAADNHGPRKGLEGPFRYPNGQVIYYDSKEGKYWDPSTDFYLDHEQASALQNSLFTSMKR